MTLSLIPPLVVTYLLNACWQIPLVYLAASLSAPLLRRLSSLAEHRLWVISLVLSFLIPVYRFQALSLLPFGRHPHSNAVGNTRISLTAHAADSVGILHLTFETLLILTLLYLLITLYFTLRLTWGLSNTLRLQRQSQPIDRFPDLWSRRANVHLATSAHVSGPVVFGIRQHWLLLPPAFLTQVDPEDLEAAFAHEFAHIQCHDFALNLLYELLALPIAFHPVTRLLRGRIAETREIVCDTIAAESVHGRQHYAASLLRLATFVPTTPHPQPFHAIGIFDANTLERRIIVMTQPRIATSSTRRILSLAACLVLAVTTCASALAFGLKVQPSTTPDGKPIVIDISKIGILSRQNPVYPAEARANHDTVNGTCTLHVIIDETGTPTQITILKSLRRDYDISAIEAVRQWRWQPYLLNGNPVAVDTNIAITYSIF